MKERQNDDN